MRHSMLSIMLSAALAGCGLKGPLYLPPPDPVVKKPVPQSPTTTPQERPVPPQSVPPPQ